MKKILVASLLGSLFSTIAFAQVGTNYAQICNSWSYNSAAGGYVCSGYPMNQQFVDVFSLNSKIQSLEARLQKLEAHLAAVSE